MPPAISDHEEGSDGELAPASTSKKMKREKKPVKYAEPEPYVDEDEEPPVDDKNGFADEDEGEDEEDQGQEDVFVVEKILSHMIKKGKLVYQVKWEGWDNPEDLTWEPEDNLEDAREALEEYYRSVGGRDKLFEETEKATKTKKRGRPPSSTPTTSGKRAKKNGDHPSDSEPPVSVRAAAWRPPAGSWEDHVAQLDACEDEDTGKLMVYLTWKNGQKTQHETSVIYQRCPQKMLRFYEQHVRIIKSRDGDSESVGTS